jgi:DNA-directed RNA polymerase subunit RPC12/RpoP
MSPQIGSTPQHCPGFQSFKNLSAFSCSCPECGAEVEIFSDEFDRSHNCPKCSKQIDFTQCKLEASGKSEDPR